MWKVIKWCIRTAWALCLTVAIAIINNWLQGKDSRNLATVLSFLSAHKWYFGLALVASWLVARFAQQRELLKAVDDNVYFYRAVERLRPADIVPSEAWYDRYFLDRRAVGRTRELLSQGRGVLLVGNPLVGKTRCAYEALRVLSGYYILALTPERVSLLHIELPRRWLILKPRVILFLDDLHRFVNKVTPDDLRKQLLGHARSVTVLATCRSGEEISIVERDQVFGSFVKRDVTTVPVEELTKAEEQVLAEHFAREWSPARFNGSPGSIVFDLDAMYQRLAGASIEAQTLMRSLSALHDIGVSAYPQAFIEKIAETVYGVGIGRAVADGAWQWLERQGFLAVSGSAVMPTHAVYLESSFRPEYASGDIVETKHKVWQIVSDSGPFEMILAVAAYLGTQSDHRMAEEAARRLVEIAPGDARGHLLLSTATAAQGNFSESEQEIREAICLDPRVAFFHAMLGAVLKEQSRNREAEQSLSEALSIDSNCGVARLYLGILRYESQKFNEAEVQLREAIRSGLESEHTRYYLGVTLSELGQQSQALEELGKAISINPDYESAHLALGILLRRVGLLDEAEHEYRAAIRCNPECEMGHAGVAGILAQRGQAEEAAKAYGDAIRCNPTDPIYRNNLGILSYKAGRNDVAAPEFKEALRLDPNCVDARLSLAAVYLDEAQLDRAEQQLREAVRRFPDSPRVHRALGVALWRQEQKGAAELAYREAISLDQDYADAHLELATILYRQHKLEAAASEFREVVRCDPCNVQGRVGLGLTLQELGLNEQAMEQYRFVSEMPDAPQRAVAQAGVAHLLAIDGRFDEAEKEAREALKQYPALVPARLTVVAALLSKGDKRRAQKELRKLA